MSSETPKTPAWREFEKLVGRIEKVLSPIDAKVTSPDRIRDLTTGQLREVDAAIRYTVGTTPILIIIECRDRNRVQDSLWIEQLASKQQSIGAAKCVAVASKGFNKAAIKKAEALGIELRKLQAFPDDEIAKWAPIRTFFYQYEITKFDPSWAKEDDFKLDADLDRKINEEVSRNHFLEDEILRPKRGGKLISLRKYTEDAINLAYDRLSELQKREFVTDEELILSWVDSQPQYSFNSSDGPYDLLGVAFGIIFKQFSDYALESRGAFGYSDMTSELVGGIEMEAVDHRGSSNKEITIHADSDSKHPKVTIWAEDGEKFRTFEVPGQNNGGEATRE